MATIDPNGVLIYQDTDNYTPIQTALNLAQSNLSSILGANTQIVKAANAGDRNAKAVARGGISKANPFVVWRADALDGLQLEYTTNGATWRTIADKEYYDSQVFDQTVYGANDALIQVRAVGKSVTVTFDGTRQWGTMQYSAIATEVIPVGLRPARQATGPVMFRWASVGVGVVDQFGTVHLWNTGPTNSLWVGSVTYTAA